LKLFGTIIFYGMIMAKDIASVPLWKRFLLGMLSIFLATAVWIPFVAVRVCAEDRRLFVGGGDAYQWCGNWFLGNWQTLQQGKPFFSHCLSLLSPGNIKISSALTTDIDNLVLLSSASSNKRSICSTPSSFSIFSLT
jgi:hypothetical protein